MRKSEKAHGKSHLQTTSMGRDDVSHAKNINKETESRKSIVAASQALTAANLKSPKEASQREHQTLISPASGNQGSAAPSPVPADAASKAAPPVHSQSDEVLSVDPSRAISGAAGLSGAAFLPEFDAKYNWDAVHENIYAVLGHGPYQRRVLICGISSVTVLLLHYLAYRLIGRQVDHWCMAPGHLASLSVAAWKNLSIPVEADGSYSRCTVYDSLEPVNQEEIRTAVPCHEWDYDIANKGDSVVSRFDLVCNQAYLYDLSSVVPMAASALLAPALGLVSDRAGRRPVMLFCAFGQLIATIGNCFAETYTFFVFTRVLIFVATDVTFLATFILIHEVTGNAHRSIFTLIDTAVPGIVVPPMMHALSLLEPRWMLAEALTIVTVALLVVWCCLQEESPAWLIATWKLRRAEAIVLLAAKENGVDLAKAGSTFMAIKEQLCKLDKYAAAAPMEVIMQTMKMRRRAVSVLLARFTLDATYIGLMLNDVTTGIPWEVAHVVLSMAYYASICGSMRRYGLRDTLSGLMVILSAFAIFEAIATFSGQQMVTSFLHAGMKVVVSGAMSVALCYTAETFPTAMRNAGISLSQCAGSVGNVVAIALVALSQPHVLYALSAFMVLLSVAAIQWLPEVLIEHQQSPSVHSEGERKAQLQASLKSRSAKSSHKHR